MKPHIYKTPDLQGPVAPVPGSWVCVVGKPGNYMHVPGETPIAAYLAAIAKERG